MASERPWEIDQELKLEMQSFADLLLDIYEWRWQEKEKAKRRE
jgi:hypothetical protein